MFAFPYFQIRKEREECNVAELKVQIVALEDALAAETKRRVDATTKLDQMSREQVYEMEERLRQQLKEDNATLESRLNKLEKKIVELEGNWEKDSRGQLDAITQKSQDFCSSLEKLKQEQDTERKSRLKREGALLEQIETHYKEFEDRWERERNDRLERIASLEEQVYRQQNKRDQDQASFQQNVQEALSLLQQELDQEIQERKKEDEDIVSALNRYTQQLQQSLSLLNN